MRGSHTGAERPCISHSAATVIERAQILTSSRPIDKKGMSSRESEECLPCRECLAPVGSKRAACQQPTSEGLILTKPPVSWAASHAPPRHHSQRYTIYLISISQTGADRPSISRPATAGRESSPRISSAVGSWRDGCPPAWHCTWDCPRSGIASARRALNFLKMRVSGRVTQSVTEPALIPLHLGAAPTRHPEARRTSLFAADDITIGNDITFMHCPRSTSEPSSYLLDYVSIWGRCQYQSRLVMDARLGCILPRSDLSNC